MAKEGDKSLINHVMEPFRRLLNSEPPKDKLSSGGKRKSSICMNDVCLPEKRIRMDAPASATPSPWEAKRLKIDLIATKAQIIKLESRINHQHTIQKEMEILFEKEKRTLMEQHKRDEKALSDMEDRLQLIRRRNQELIDDYNQEIKERKQCKAMWDKKQGELQKQVADLKDQLLECTVSSKDQLSEMKKDMDELLQALEGAQSEVEILKTELDRQTSRAEQCTTLRTQLEKQTFELQSVTNKLKELEYERDSYKDWHIQAKTAQNRLTNMAKLEKEVARLRSQERSIRECIGNKLLLEEQVNTLQSRVDTLQPVHNELREAKVKLACLESYVEEWKAAARNHGIEDARSLSNTLDTALDSQLEATASSSQAQSQLAQLAEEVTSVKFERNKVTGKLNELLIVRKSQESLIHRLQKRLLLVTRERDSYRQQLDCNEKELAVTLCGEPGAGNVALLSARVEHLEKALQGYRDLMATHDQTAHTKLVESLRAESSKWREEAENLKGNVAKLRAQRNTLHANLERIGAHSQTKALHLTNNAAAEAQKQIIQAELEAAQDELKQLKATLREGGGASACPEEMQQLRQQLENSRITLKSLKEEFTATAQEYREVCFMLLGYKVDRTEPKNYRITNMYAESSEQYLKFTLNHDSIDMVQTDYSSTLTELVELHLRQHRSIPLFLSTLTMELFTRAAMQQVQ